MTAIKDDPIYRSANDDDWLIHADLESSKLSVVHWPNASLGSQESLHRSTSSQSAAGIRRKSL